QNAATSAAVANRAFVLRMPRPFARLSIARNRAIGKKSRQFDKLERILIALERVPIAWNHAIEMDSLKTQKMEHVSENRFALF
ncbi:MAG TPA: hypothetical protein VED87_11890, partial [Methylocystis sp.]|nr:hypothetical protein [Methylocystis sp.]